MQHFGKVFKHSGKYFEAFREMLLNILEKVVVAAVVVTSVKYTIAQIYLQQNIELLINLVKVELLIKSD